MERRECPECGNRTYNEVCDNCGSQTQEIEELEKQAQGKFGGKWASVRTFVNSINHFYQESKVLWNFLILWVVLGPLLGTMISAAITDEYHFYDHWRYEEAAVGTAVDLPVIEPQVLAKTHGIQVVASSIGKLDGTPVLKITVANRSFKDVRVGIGQLTVNGNPRPYDGANFNAEMLRKSTHYVVLHSKDLACVDADAASEITATLVLRGTEWYNMRPRLLYRPRPLYKMWEETIDVTIKTDAAQ